MMDSHLLHVCCVVFNPLMWHSRVALYHKFEEEMLANGVNLTTVECQLGQRPFILTNPKVHHVKTRVYSAVFNKENLLNIGFADILRREPSAEYFAWIDTDVHFRDPHWAGKAVDALQQYAVIQPWSDVYLLGPHEHHLDHQRSFIRVWKQGGGPQKTEDVVVAKGPNWWKKDGGQYLYPHSGFAWCARRRALEDVGMLLDTAVVGSGDHHMAHGLVGTALKTIPQQMSDGYKRPVIAWQTRALRHVNQNIGFLWGTIEHWWHGSLTNRQYWNRWEIFIKNRFDPDTDLKKNGYGVVELAGNKPQLTHDVDMYLRSRDEDSNFI